MSEIDDATARTLAVVLDPEEANDVLVLLGGLLESDFFDRWIPEDAPEDPFLEDTEPRVRTVRLGKEERAARIAQVRKAVEKVCDAVEHLYDDYDNPAGPTGVVKGAE